MNINIGLIKRDADGMLKITNPNFAKLDIDTEEPGENLIEGNVCLFTTDSVGRINHYSEPLAYRRMLVANLLNLSQSDFLIILNCRTGLFKVLIYEKFKEDIDELLVTMRLKILGSIDKYKMGTTTARRYKAGEDNYKIYMIALPNLNDSYLKVLIQGFTYDKSITHYVDLSDNEPDYDLTDYNNSLDKVSVHLREYIFNNYNQHEHNLSLLENILLFIQSTLLKILYDDNLIKFAWKYLSKSSSKFLNSQMLSYLIVSYMITKFKQGKTITEVHGKLWSNIYKPSVFKKKSCA